MIDAASYQGPAPRRDVRWDDDITGFGVRIYPTGKKSFVLSYRVGGRKRLLALGQYGKITLDQARKMARTELASVISGKDPVEARRRQAEAATVRELAQEYIERYAKPNKRSWREDERILNYDVVPRLGTHRIEEVTRKQVNALLDRIVNRGAPIQANRTLACVRRMFNFAVARSLIDASPVTHIEAPTKEQPKKRALTDDELRRFWEELGTATYITDTVKRAIKLILVTAQRPGEVAALSWTEIEGDWWTIPGERAKNGLEHRVPLTDIANGLIGAKNGAEYVFPSYKGRPITVSGIARAVRALVHQTGLAAFTPHDLRRTAATRLGELGFNRLIQDKILNHRDRTIGGVYDHYSYDREKRAALEAWERKLNQIVTGETESNVIDIHAR